MGRSSFVGSSFVVALSGLLVAAPALMAQDAGTIEGTVRATGSGTPLSDVVVSVQGTTRGAMTDAQGKFRIAAVPLGERVVLAQLVGRDRGAQTVSVAADACSSGSDKAASLASSRTRNAIPSQPAVRSVIRAEVITAGSHQDSRSAIGLTAGRRHGRVARLASHRAGVQFRGHPRCVSC